MSLQHPLCSVYILLLPRQSGYVLYRFQTQQQTRLFHRLVKIQNSEFKVEVKIQPWQSLYDSKTLEQRGTLGSGSLYFPTSTHKQKTKKKLTKILEVTMFRNTRNCLEPLVIRNK